MAQRGLGASSEKNGGTPTTLFVTTRHVPAWPQKRGRVTFVSFLIFAPLDHHPPTHANQVCITPLLRPQRPITLALEMWRRWRAFGFVRTPGCVAVG
jgi:hypothetical protein